MVSEDNISYRFKYKGLIYGWYNKELYRLPYNKKRRYYKLKKLILQKDGRYKLGGCNKSMVGLEKMTLGYN